MTTSENISSMWANNSLIIPAKLTSQKIEKSRGGLPRESMLFVSLFFFDVDNFFRDNYHGLTRLA